MSKKIVVGIIVFLSVIVIAAVAITSIFVFNQNANNDLVNDQVVDNQEEVLTENETNDTNEINKEQEPEETKKEFSMGEWNANVYSNDFLGIKYTLPEGWTYSSDEEIANMMNLGTEMLNDDQKLAAEVSKLTSAYYMVAKNPTTGDNVSVLSEKPIRDVSTSYYLNQVKTQLAALDSLSYDIGETSKEKVAGREYDTLIMTEPNYGITQKYYVYKMDEYFVSLVLTSTNGAAGLNEIIKCFE